MFTDPQAIKNLNYSVDKPKDPKPKVDMDKTGTNTMDLKDTKNNDGDFERKITKTFTKVRLSLLFDFCKIYRTRVL